MGNTSWQGPCSVAMLVYRSVRGLGNTSRALGFFFTGSTTGISFRIIVQFSSRSITTSLRVFKNQMDQIRQNCPRKKNIVLLREPETSSFPSLDFLSPDRITGTNHKKKSPPGHRLVHALPRDDARSLTNRLVWTADGRNPAPAGM